MRPFIRGRGAEYQDLAGAEAAHRVEVNGGVYSLPDFRRDGGQEGLRAHAALFLAVESGENDRARGGVPPVMAREFQQQRNSGSVVIGSREQGAPGRGEVVVVRGEHQVLIGLFPALRGIYNIVSSSAGVPGRE